MGPAKARVEQAIATAMKMARWQILEKDDGRRIENDFIVPPTNP
jgi:hypothetical protein